MSDITGCIIRINHDDGVCECCRSRSYDECHETTTLSMLLATTRSTWSAWAIRNSRAGYSDSPEICASCETDGTLPDFGDSLTRQYSNWFTKETT